MPWRQYKSEYLLLICASLIYLPCLWFDFSADDFAQIVYNFKLRNINNFFNLLTAPATPGNLWRPVPVITYFLSYQIFSLNTFVFHLSNLLLHLISGILVFHFLKSLFEKELALLASLIFILHPLNSEVASSITGRTESLAACGILLTLIIAGSEIKSWKKYFLVFLTALFSFASKESAVVLIPLLALYSLQKKISLSCFIYCFLSTLIAFTFYISARFQIVNFYPIPFIDNPLVALTPIVRTIEAIKILGYYLRLFILPYPVLADYSYNYIQLGKFTFLDILNLALISIGICLILFGKPKVRFAACWFFLAFIITSNIVFPIGTIFANRLFYLPSIGICLLTAYLLLKIRLKKLQIIYLIILAAFSSYTIINWKDDKQLIQRHLLIATKNAKIYEAYARNKLLEGDFPTSVYSAKRALAIYPEYSEAKKTLIKLSYFQKNFTESEKNAAAELKFSPDDVELYNLLARSQLSNDKPEAAEKTVLQALKINPTNHQTYVTMIYILTAQGRIQEAQKLQSEMLAKGQVDEDFERASEFLESAKIK